MTGELALLGNPNSGKTTLFNALTGTYQKTGNWTGVTTEKKDGEYKKDRSVKIVDLPGVYSLDKGSADENAVLEYLNNNKPKAIINIVDGTNLERNLYLTFQLLKLNIPMVVAVNMYDELKKNNINLNTDELSKILGVKIVPISALKGTNIDLLMTETSSVKLPVTMVNLPQNDTYKYIESVIAKIIDKKQTKAEIFTQKLDNLLTHKILGIPIFICLITLIYFLSINVGGFFGQHISKLFDFIISQTTNSLYKIATPEWLVSLLCNGIFKGVGTVLAFLPQVLILFALMTMIEQSGYASRIAFNLDRVFRVFGLGGKSLIPMILSCGCTVAGLTATRTIENENEKKMTLFLSPFMPCSAKMAVFAWFSTKFFGGKAIVATGMYFLSFVAVILFGLILKKFKSFRQNSGDFILEMPTMRLPSIKDVFAVMWEKTKDFTAKAGSVIFIVSVIIWLLMNVGVKGYTYSVIEDSFLYNLGNMLKYIFYPLGFGNWQATVAVLTGMLAKEGIIETLEIIGVNFDAIFANGWAVVSFMSFILLSPPCMASIAMAKRELKSKKLVVHMIIFQFVSAYTIAFIINGIGYLIINGLLLAMIIVIIIAVVFAVCLAVLKNRKCTNCSSCKKGGNKCPENIKRNTI